MAQALNKTELHHISVIETDFLNQVVKKQITNDSFPNELLTNKSSADLASEVCHHKQFDANYRNKLADIISRQYKQSHIELEPDSLVFQNIEKLRKPSTVTSTTGQQIHIFLGPFFVVNKLLTCCAQAKKITDQLLDHDCVPIFWMATEDHDFEEINSVKLYNETYTWEIESEGPVGRLNPRSILSLVEQAKTRIDQTDENIQFLRICEYAYANCNTYADASRYIIHHIFKHTGIVVLDPDDRYLKSQFSETLKSDLFDHAPSGNIDQSIKVMKSHGIKPPINTRAINTFYIEDSKRVRIEPVSKNEFTLVDGSQTFTKADIEQLIETKPEVFSPNALLRPIYQQTILPNIDYVCGMSEFVYWLEIGRAMERENVTYPRLTHRKSLFFTNQKNIDILVNSNAPLSYLFLDEDNFILNLNHVLNEKSVELREQVELIKTGLDNLERELSKVQGLRTQRIAKYKGLLDEELKNVLIEHAKLTSDNSKLIEKISKVKSKIFVNSFVQERNTSILQMIAEMHICIQKYSSDSNIFVDNTFITLASK